MPLVRRKLVFAQAASLLLISTAVSVDWAGATRQQSGVASAPSIVSAKRKAAGASIPTNVVTPNWSGYVAGAPVKSSFAHPYFTSVTGTWTVPTADCAHANRDDPVPD